MKTPSLFGPDKEKRLEAVREKLIPLEASLHSLQQKARAASDEADKSRRGSEISRLEREMQPLQDEEKQLEDLQEFSEEFDKKVRPILAIAGEIAKVMPGPAAEAIAPLVGGLLKTYEKLDETHARYRALIAKQRMNAFKAYLQVGFTADQAMRLVEADAQACSPLDAFRDNLKVNFKV